MNSLSVFRTLVIGATVLVDLALLDSAVPFPHPTSVVLLGLILAQFAALTELIAATRWPAALRVTVLAGTAAATARMLELFTAPNAPAWFALLGAFALMMWMPAAMKRFHGTSRGRIACRYSIAHMIDWTTAVAILMGCLRLVEMPRSFIAPGILYCGLLAATCFLTRHIILRRRSMTSNIARGMLCGALIGCVLSRVENTGPVPAFVVLGMVLAGTTMLLAAIGGRRDLIVADCPAPVAGG